MASGCCCSSRKTPASLPPADEPDWVADWLADRVERATKKTEQAASAAEKPVDLESQARRAAQRDARVRDGVAGCRVWLEDLVRRGLAAAQSDPPADWERAAARLVDAQAPGLASFVRRIPTMMASGPGWDTRTVDLLGRLHLLLCAAQRLDDLPADVAGDVRTALGWTQSREDALGSAGVADRWIAIGQVIEEEERFRVARTWLVGQNTGRRALILDFAAGSQPLERSIAAGSAFDGELAFYPSRQPLRALLKSRSESHVARSRLRTRMATRRSKPDCSAMPRRSRPTRGSSDGRSCSPDVRPVQDGARWFLVDAQDHGLPVRPAFARSLQLWRLISARGGSPMTVVVEWDGISALPISAFSGSPAEYLDLAPRWAA